MFESPLEDKHKIISFELREYEYDDWLMNYDTDNLMVANYYNFETDFNEKETETYSLSNFLKEN